jgi:Signal peptide peptidase
VCKGGYFVPSVIAYAIGLLMANMAVYLMNMGQPALLYLVPCCLGTMSFMAWRRNEFSSLWEGPKAIRTVDELLYGPLEENDSGNHGHVPVPLEDGLDAPSAPSAQDEGDLPLVSVQDDSPKNII